MRAFARPSFAPIALLIAALPLLADCRGRSTPGGPPPARVVVDHATLVHDGLERSYQVHVPRPVRRRGDPVPVVIVLHGGGGNAESAVRITGFSEKALEEGFVAVYPDGTGPRANRVLTWNAGHCCGWAMENDVDDVGFVAALIDRLAADYPVDRRRVYVTGMSHGAIMAHRLGIEIPDRIAAIGPVVGALFGDETPPASPVAAIMVNGALDESVPHRGGPPGGPFRRSWDGTPVEPATYQAEFWARANGCGPEPDVEEDPAVTVWRHDCPSGAPVELWLVKDNGHAWPGGERGSRRPAEQREGRHRRAVGLLREVRTVSWQAAAEVVGTIGVTGSGRYDPAALARPVRERRP